MNTITLLPIVLLAPAPQPTQQSASTTAEAIAESPFPAEPLFIRMGDDEGKLDTPVTTTPSIESAVYSPDGKLIATVAKGDGSIRLWTAEGEPLWTMDGGGETECLAFTRDARYLVTGGEASGRQLQVRRVADGSLVRSDDIGRSIEGMLFSPDYDMLATGTEAGEILIWDTTSSDPQDWHTEHILVQGSDLDRKGSDRDDTPGGDWDGHSDVNQVDWGEIDGTLHLVSAGRNRLVKVWDATRFGEPDGGFVRALPGAYGSIKAVRISPDGSMVLASSGGRGGTPPSRLMAWDLRTGEALAMIDINDYIGMDACGWTPDGEWALSGGTFSFPPEKGGLEGSNHPGGPQHYIGCFSAEEIRKGTFRNATVTKESDLPGFVAFPVFDMEFFSWSPDGSKAITSHSDGSFRVWEMQ